MDWISIIAAPPRFLIYSVTFALSFLITLLRVLTSPLLRLGVYVVHLSLFPLRVLAKFENILSFFGTAVVVGLITGLILYFTSSFIFQVLQLTPEKSTQRRPPIRKRQQRGYKDFSGFRPRTTLHHWKPDNPKYLPETDSDHDSRSPGTGPSSPLKKEPDEYFASWKEEFDNMGEPKERGLLSTMILEEEDDISGH
ncbi:hypothetical protein FQN54_008583 [Arachnomyces sp. PD_36]|nr:hypothetical protein FQN54_008583 [Arachnomyces sp. PD_36]